MRSRAVKRIEDVAMLRSAQMPGWLACVVLHCLCFYTAWTDLIQLLRG